MKNQLLRVSVVCLTALLLFVSCGTVPSSEEKSVKLEDVDWTVAVEGVNGKTEYTMAMAKEKPETKVYCRMYNTVLGQGGAAENKATTRMFEGVLVGDMLDQLGVTSFSSLTFVDTDGKEIEIDADLAKDGETILAWKENKTNPVPDSESLVALTPAKGKIEQVMKSVAKIIVNP